MRIHTRLVVAASALAAIVLLAAPVCAQDAMAADPQLAALAGRVRTGDKVVVTDLDGQVVKGRFATLSPEAMTVLVDGNTRTVPVVRIARVQRTRTGVLLGAIIGGGAGFATGAALASLFGNEGGNTTAAFLVPLTIGLGAGIGIDALVNLPRTVYRRELAARVTAVPIAGAGRKGAAVSVTF
jgi:hypothetical protein